MEAYRSNRGKRGKPDFLLQLTTLHFPGNGKVNKVVSIRVFQRNWGLPQRRVLSPTSQFLAGRNLHNAIAQCVRENCHSNRKIFR